MSNISETSQDSSQAAHRPPTTPKALTYLHYLCGSCWLWFSSFSRWIKEKKSQLCSFQNAFFFFFSPFHSLFEAIGSDGIKQWRYFSISITIGQDGKGFPGVHLTLGVECSQAHLWLSDDGDVDTQGWWLQALHGEWSMKPHALGSPFTFLGQSVTFDQELPEGGKKKTKPNPKKQTNKNAHDP